MRGLSASDAILPHLGLGQIVPLIPPPGTPGAGTKGTGRFPTITEAAFVLFQYTRSRHGQIRARRDADCSSRLRPPRVRRRGHRWCAFVFADSMRFSINGRSLDMPACRDQSLRSSRGRARTTRRRSCVPARCTPWPTPTGATDKTAGTKSEEKNYPFYSRCASSAARRRQRTRFQRRQDHRGNSRRLLRKARLRV